MLTLERASELVSALRDSDDPLKATDLFDHFVDVLKIKEHALIDFALLCGYLVAGNVMRIDKEVQTDGNDD